MNGEDQDRRVLCDIARSAFGVVDRLLSRDQLLSRELRSSTTGSRQIYREECITVEVATELRERFPEHVEITLFTPPEETRTGADWYWRFEKDGGAIHARVQAKRVQRTEFGQADPAGHVEIDLPQLDDLLDGVTGMARAREFAELQAWVATFVRFPANPPCGQTDLQGCSRHSHHARCVVGQPSLWIAQAREIREVGRSRLQARDVVKLSLRLDCILPCIDGQDDGRGPSTKGFALLSGLPPYQDCVAAIEADVRMRKEFEGALRIRI
ncbi:MAG: hypothetical protein KF830_13860 [Planctomycetes bacterium]|nr:hypothetical protein [Planctomycetota bacterium]